MVQRRSLFGFDPEPRRPRSDGDAERPLAIAEITRLVKRRIEESWDSVLVTGEISNFTRAQSGHLYFTLKDAEAQLPCVMWRSAVARSNARVGDGDAVVARGRLTLYEARGQFQMVVERLDPVGAGDLERRFRELRARYQEMGWFAAGRKRPLPFLPGAVALVTSPRGAAVHDVLRTLLARFPRAHVVVVPTRVQGPGAADDVARAIRRAIDREAFDVLIVGRGGGSVEDLWAFNEPPVVEAIHDSPIPVVSAVGHEVDVTLSDLVADHRALTPTAAGEVVVPDLLELEGALHGGLAAMTRALRRRLREARLRLDAAGRHWALRQPRQLVERERQRLDEVSRRLPALLTARLERTGARAAQLGRMLETLSPLRVLERGYSITFDAATGRALRTAAAAAEGARLRTRLADGDVESVVTGTDGEPPSPRGAAVRGGARDEDC